MNIDLSAVYCVCRVSQKYVLCLPSVSEVYCVCVECLRNMFYVCRVSHHRKTRCLHSVTTACNSNNDIMIACYTAIYLASKYKIFNLYTKLLMTNYRLKKFYPFLRGGGAQYILCRLEAKRTYLKA